MPDADHKLFLLDGMALVYRAHFAFVTNPIRTAAGRNTSAIYGFSNTLLELLTKQKPTHLAVVFDTAAPTARHVEFPAYKAQRQEMPEELSAAIPDVKRMIRAFNFPVLELDGYEADDIIGTLAREAEAAGYTTYMVTPDKDFGQLVTGRTLIYKPGRRGDDHETLGIPEVLAKWGIVRTDQVRDILGLWGDTSDNIPGIPGIGEKTAQKLIAQYDSLENLLDHAEEQKGKLKESLVKFREQALLSKRLATIDTKVPLPFEPEELHIGPRDDETLKALLTEFEFNTLGRRLFGEGFKAGRGAGRDGSPLPSVEGREGTHVPTKEKEKAPPLGTAAATSEVAPEHPPIPPLPVALRTIEDVKPIYKIWPTFSDYLATHFDDLARLKYLGIAFDLGPDLTLRGIALSGAAQQANYISLEDCFAPDSEIAWLLPHFVSLLSTPNLTLVGHDLKAGLRAWTSEVIKLDLPLLAQRLQQPDQGLEALERDKDKISKEKYENIKAGKSRRAEQQKKFYSEVQSGKIRVDSFTTLFDTALAHAVVFSDLRHSLTFAAESLLNYTPIPNETGAGQQDFLAELEAKPGVEPETVELLKRIRPVMERADLALQLHAVLAPKLAESGQEKIFTEIESPLLPVLAAMENEGIRLDPAALEEVGRKLRTDLTRLEASIYEHAGTKFNIGSPKQLGEILFGKLVLDKNAKKTKTGQYSTDEQTLSALAPLHPIIREILDYREASKLLSTYIDALPNSVSPVDGRIHTTFYQLATSTGRLNSQDPNLQNIPIRTAQGREIRRAFVPREGDYTLLSADYSQIELRILAALTQDPGLLEALTSGEDIHRATAAKVFGLPLAEVSKDQRNQAKMVNYGISYGISAFGLSQRLGIARGDAKNLIDGYFAQYPGIKQYMTDTVAVARERGYVETITGRRRYLPDLRSANATVRASAERNAINMPIQGSSADLIKIAMVHIGRVARHENWRTKLLLQVHDELVFDLYLPEKDRVLEIVLERMKNALPELKVPIVVEAGTGPNWLEAH
jgi:DNA polymerase-1